jgi:hypothetical protein
LGLFDLYGGSVGLFYQFNGELIGGASGRFRFEAADEFFKLGDQPPVASLRCVALLPLKNWNGGGGVVDLCESGTNLIAEEVALPAGILLRALRRP